LNPTKILGAGAICAAAIAPLTGHAQVSGDASAVSIYGVIDIGVTHVNNAGGGSVTRLDDGIAQGSRLGFRGREDLGGGRAAVFNLEMGIASDTGALRQGGLAFGRASFVGISDAQWGTFTAGRQVDQQIVTLLRFHPALNGGIYGVTPGDADRIAGNWLDNSLVYASPDFSGLKFSIQRALSENQTSSTNKGNAWSGGVSYGNGPFNIGYATTHINGLTILPGAFFGVSKFFGAALPTPATPATVSRYGTQGLGASYAIGGATVAALTTRTNYESASGAREAMKTLGFSVSYRLGNLLLSTGIQRAKLDPSAWTTANVVADYFLSKRTDAYVSLNTQHASGPGTHAVLALNSPSSDDKQSAIRVGFRHRF